MLSILSMGSLMSKPAKGVNDYPQGRVRTLYQSPWSVLRA